MNTWVKDMLESEAGETWQPRRDFILGDTPNNACFHRCLPKFGVKASQPKMMATCGLVID